MSKNFDNLQMFYKKLSPSLAALLGAGAGWALSDALTQAPPSNMTPQQQMEWERLVERAMKRKSTDVHSYEIDPDKIKKSIYNLLQKTEPGQQATPPRAGDIFDPVKHRWTNPKNVGKTVSEVQGKIRRRASGAGGESKRLAVGRIGGKGTEGSAGEGRKFRGKTDITERAKELLKPRAQTPEAARGQQVRKDLLKLLFS